MRVPPVEWNVAIAEIASWEATSQRYFNELLIDVNMLLRLVPNPFTVAMIAIEIPAAIRPYSIAVAPASSDRN